MIEAPTRVERKLEKSGRITPKEVLEAYEETGLTPHQSYFRDADTACGLGVLMARDGLDARHAPIAIEGWIKQRDAAAGEYYSNGFWRAFDSHVLPLPNTVAERKGYRDGQRVRRFVLSRYPELADE
jgi:hypothetical protein